MNKPRSIRSLLKSFIESDASNGMVLILAAVAAMVLANNAATAQGYQNLLAEPVQIRFGALEINKNMLLWINDALMAVFFLLVGLEVKRELVLRLAGQPPARGVPGDCCPWRDGRAGAALPGVHLAGSCCA